MVDLVIAPETPAGSTRVHFAPWKDPSEKPLISFQKVSRRFGTTMAVDDVSLDLFRSEMFCLLGPSGCGKTTLLRMLAGFEAVDHGQILLDGVDQSAIPPHQRQINMMFQSYALFPHLTVARNIGFGLRQLGMKGTRLDERVAELMSLVQLQGLADRRPHQLSGGQKQRVALARALAREPKVLLLDEPMAALDARIREDTQRELKQIQHRTGTTFVVVTHDQNEAMSMADRIGVMQGGRLVQVGTPADIYERPANRDVARFVGNVNLFDATVLGRNDAGQITLSCADLPGGLVAEGAGLVPAAGTVVSVAVRPERLAVEERNSATTAANMAHGTISSVTYLGDVINYLIRLEGGSTLTVSVVNDGRRQQSSLNIAAGVTVCFDPRAAMVLSA